MVQKACLVVIDGWGISAETRGNAVSNASTPSMEALSKMASQPLSAHGLSVGLPVGLMGNSEVGHLNIGAGRIVYQDIVRIELAISHNSLCAQPAVKDAFHAAKLNGQIHLAGLVSDGGVHSHISHLLVLLQGAKDAGITNAYVHVFGDGRDVAPKSIKIYLEMLQTWMDENNYGSVATITGRYYAMDRDKRWERVKAAYDGMCHGVGEKTQDYMATIDKRYEGGETDEFFKPIICDPAGSIKNGHVVLCFNFRSDRMREISQAFIAPPFETQAVTGLNVTTMTVYKAEFPFPTIFPPQTMSNCLGEWLAAQKIPQYAHVTFFFNGGKEEPFDLEERIMVPSPKVPTYDNKPEMSSIQVGQAVCDVLKKNAPFVMCNFAPPDMVGHTGNYEKAILGVEATDKAIGMIHKACVENKYTLFVTADHGNAEQMLNGEEPHTAHTCNPVPFYMAGSGAFITKSDAALCDVAPTILDFMGLPIPAEMTGSSLLKH